MQQLRDDEVRDLVVDRRADEHDPLVQQAGVDVERALSARALLDDHRYQWHLAILSTTVRLSNTIATNRLSKEVGDVCSQRGRGRGDARAGVGGARDRGGTRALAG